MVCSCRISTLSPRAGFHARTRRHIREHWPDAQINGRKLIFPDRKLTTIRYNINKVYDGLYDCLRRLIEPPNPKENKGEGIRYARYGLIDYVDPAMHSKSPYSDLARAGLRLSGLMRSLLFKRLESSVEAFRCTVSHLLESACRRCLEVGNAFSAQHGS